MDKATEWALRFDPSRIMSLIGLEPDPWQRDLLNSQASRILLLASRQIGKEYMRCMRCIARSLPEPRGADPVVVPNGASVA